MLAQLTYIRKFLSFVADQQETKVDTVISMLEYLPRPVIIFSSFNETLEKLHEVIPNSGIFNADYTDEDVNKFKFNEIDVLLLQIKSGKFGHSFTNARSVIYIDKSFDADDYYQSLGRVKRLTSTLPVTYYHLEFVNSIDKVIKFVLDNRIGDMQKILSLVEDSITEKLS